MTHSFTTEQEDTVMDMVADTDSVMDTDTVAVSTADTDTVAVADTRLVHQEAH